MCNMSKCYDCGKEVSKGIFRCTQCLKRITGPHKAVRRRGLTEWETLKLSFYKSDKKWEDNIRSRTMVNGKPFYKTSKGELRPLPSSSKRPDGEYR